jgi:hypothetical protein
MTTIGAKDPAVSGYLHALGSAIASFGHPVILTFAHEFNVSGQYPWAQGDCENTSPAQWIQAWDTVPADIDTTAGGLAHFLWAAGADTGGTTIDPTPYWPGAAEVDMIGVEGVVACRRSHRSGVDSSRPGGPRRRSRYGCRHPVRPGHGSPEAGGQVDERDRYGRVCEDRDRRPPGTLVRWASRAEVVRRSVREWPR